MDNPGTTAYRIRTHALPGYFLTGGLNWTLSTDAWDSPEMAETGRARADRRANVDPTRTVIIPIYIKKEN